MAECTRTSAIVTLKTMGEHWGTSAFALALPRGLSSFMTSFAVVALLLASIGLYGVMAHSVSRQKRELGIRMALGARRDTVMMTVLGQGLRLAGIGTVLGLLGAFGVARLLASAMPGIQLDLTTFVAVPAILLSIALLACYVPARRATRVEPMEVLRHE